MAQDVLDETDRGILYLLQQNARETTAAEIAEAVGVSAGTVRNRIDRLEEQGVLEGYIPDIDYETAGFELHIFHVHVRNPADDRVRRGSARSAWSCDCSQTACRRPKPPR